MPGNDYDQWFSKLTGHSKPRSWQEELSKAATCRNRLIRIPTGLGKTEGVLAAWSFHRLHQADDRWPRRLIWCLPMRVLVEQTAQVAENLIRHSGTSVGIHCLMGGVSPAEWHLSPEQPAILIGTQDMLISRALNRGYASGRARWPHEYGLLNQDCLWVMDEVQLMDVGLATSAQIQSFRDEAIETSLRPCFSWWMSATLQPEWLRSVDTETAFEDWSRDPVVIPPDERAGGMWEISKSLTTTAIDAKDSKALATTVLEGHAAIEPTDFGRITLVVCNTVDRAIATHAALKSAGRADGLELVHSRFRPNERKAWSQFLNRSACTSEADRIIVATQVVEAGVDISAGCLITELAPWPSLVQRFGRCARYGGRGHVIVVDRGQDEKSAPPYAHESLTSAWNAIQSLTDVGIGRLEEFEGRMDDEQRRLLYPYSPQHLLMQDEFDELFDTTPDLTGADLDISRFIRSGDERDLQVFWLDLAKNEEPDRKRQPHRNELCAVQFLKAQDWLCGKKNTADRAWVWDWIDGEWEPARRELLLPGRIVCVDSHLGGYMLETGFSPSSRAIVSVVDPMGAKTESDAVNDADNQQDGEPLSHNDWKTIAFHSQEVAAEVESICKALNLPSETIDLMKLAARWHDIGKSHPAFQGTIRKAGDNPRPSRSDLAKGPDAAWLRRPNLYRYLDDSEQRFGFRHELASALALFAVLRMFEPQHPALLGPWVDVLAAMSKSVPNSALAGSHPTIRKILDCSADDFDLLVYLVASHHGKVRVALHAAPADQKFEPAKGDRNGLPIRGVRNGDVLPSITLTPDGTPLPELPLTLEPAAMGLSFETGASWRERTQKLIERHGPTTLGFLEALLRTADVRASRSSQVDPVFAQEVSE